MAESLTEKTKKGVFWNSIDKIANYGIGFIVGVVLARLLSPEEYGLLGIIGIFTAIFNVILDSGLSTALIRKDGVTDTDYCTVFYTNIVLSIILTFVLFISAPFISTFFNRSELTPYTRVMSFILIVNALSLTQQTRLTKRIDFKTQTKISVIAHTSSGIIGISMAILGYGVWALVFQQLSSRFFTTVLLWIYNRWVPRMVFSWTSFTELFGFGWKLLLASVINSVWNQLYQGVIGKVYSPNTLGQYTRAQQYTNLVATTISDVVLKVSLPVMSEIQNDDVRLLRGFRTMIKTTMLVCCIFVFGMAAASKSLVYVLIGKQWLDCVPMMQIVSFSFVLYPLHLININMLTVQGRSDIQLILQIVKCVLAIGPIILGIYLSIYWMLWGSVIIGWISLFLNAYYSGQKFGYTFFDQLIDIAPSFGIAFAMGIPVYALSFLPLNPFILLPIQIVVGATVTYFICEKTKTEEYMQLKSMALSYISKIRRKYS